MRVTLVKQGSLGLKFTPNIQTGTVELLAINPGTQAETHTQLRAGLVVHSVEGAHVAGLAYEQVLGKIKNSGRPLTIEFLPGGGGVSAPRMV